MSYVVAIHTRENQLQIESLTSVHRDGIFYVAMKGSSVKVCKGCQCCELQSRCTRFAIKYSILTIIISFDEISYKGNIQWYYVQVIDIPFVNFLSYGKKVNFSSTTFLDVFLRTIR